MAQAIIIFKKDAKLKKDAKKVLDEMGLNFSIILNDYLKKIISEQRIEFTTKEIPNTRLRKAIKQAREDYRKGKLKSFTNLEDFEKSLMS